MTDMSTNTDPLTADLPRAVRREGRYALRPATLGYGTYDLWTDYIDDEDNQKRSFCIRFGLGGYAFEDFDTIIDEDREEMRILVESAKQEFGL